MSDVTEWGSVGLRVLSTAATDAPRQAGVYLFLDRHGDVLYVGKPATYANVYASTRRSDAPSRGCIRSTTWSARWCGRSPTARKLLSGGKRI